MANESQNKSNRSRTVLGSFSSDAASLESWDDIDKLVKAAHVEKRYLSYDELLFKLKRWWSQYYKRPYKDPLLETYTFEELLYEYLDINHEENKPSTEQKVSEALEKEDRDWAEEEAQREMEEEEARALEEAQVAEAVAIQENDSIEEAEGLSDEEWAEKTLNNPTPDDIDSEDGDISATFEE